MQRLKKEMRFLPIWITIGKILYLVVVLKTVFWARKIDTVNEPKFIMVDPKAGKSKKYIITAADRDGLKTSQISQ